MQNGSQSDPRDGESHSMETRIASGVLNVRDCLGNFSAMFMHVRVGDSVACVFVPGHSHAHLRAFQELEVALLYPAGIWCNNFLRSLILFADLELRLLTL